MRFERGNDCRDIERLLALVPLANLQLEPFAALRAGDAAGHHWMEPDAVLSVVTERLLDQYDVQVQIALVAGYRINRGVHYNFVAVSNGPQSDRSRGGFVQLHLDFCLDPG